MCSGAPAGIEGTSNLSHPLSLISWCSAVLVSLGSSFYSAMIHTRFCAAQVSRERKKQEFGPVWLHTLIAALHAAANIALNSAAVGF